MKKIGLFVVSLLVAASASAQLITAWSLVGNSNTREGAHLQGPVKSVVKYEPLHLDESQMAKADSLQINSEKGYDLTLLNLALNEEIKADTLYTSRYVDLTFAKKRHYQVPIVKSPIACEVYSENGLLTGKRSSLGSLLFVYDRDTLPNNMQLILNDRMVGWTIYTYDSLNRIRQIDLSNGTQYRHVYNHQNGRLAIRTKFEKDSDEQKLVEGIVFRYQDSTLVAASQVRYGKDSCHYELKFQGDGDVATWGDLGHGITLLTQPADSGHVKILKFPGGQVVKNYDQYGNETSSVRTESDNSEVQYTRTDYLYDSHGNWLYRRTYQGDQVSSIEIRKITYY